MPTLRFSATRFCAINRSGARNGRYKQAAYQAYIELNRLGYDQVPTSSTWSFYGITGQTIRLTIEENFNKEHLLGFMTAPWLFTAENNYYALFDTWRLGRAKKICLENGKI